MATSYREFQSRLPLEGKVSHLRFVGTLAILAFLLVASAVAQSRFQGGPPAAGSGPALDVSAGYSYLMASIPGAGRVNLNGMDASGRLDFATHWGATVDTGYVRTSNIFGTGNGGYVLTFLGGPVYYPIERGNTRMFLHALGGAGLVDSVVPTGSTTYLHGWVARYAYAVGGGVERSISSRFGVRVSGDYLRTAFVDSADVVQLQNNLRVTVSFVVRLKERHGF